MMSYLRSYGGRGLLIFLIKVYRGSIQKVESWPKTLESVQQDILLRPSDAG